MIALVDPATIEYGPIEVSSDRAKEGVVDVTFNMKFKGGAHIDITCPPGVDFNEFVNEMADVMREVTGRKPLVVRESGEC